MIKKTIVDGMRSRVRKRLAEGEKTRRWRNKVDYRRGAMIELGQKVKDRITGYEGIAIARLEYISGCIQYCVKPNKLDEKGKIIEGEYIDVGQLEIVGDGISLSAKDWGVPNINEKVNGGIMSDKPSEKYSG